ncbi:hypothetical protein DGI_1132 [Megalodesulfovibrio gigas DSM 1382 = ATCC 19364]|uniref:Uncharacterized protein n=1 Tax=Megalodesulfovibrio gigas (strain ATCC 19364 / DSM 1382 / NCIMB 9332 / VKM B-1759) TaxID=1121448 RepID=T2G9N7_MEGG1|nr:hypothetical protein DGI_1132 [Megalodesulfovibrio gigas DSM 1382 = ATCC 19364]
MGVPAASLPKDFPLYVQVTDSFFERAGREPPAFPLPLSAKRDTTHSNPIGVPPGHAGGLRSYP